MNGILFSAAAFVIALGLLITVHEFGHFWVARRLGVKVLRFSVGFGRPLWSLRAGRDQTEYVIAVLPLGGYVKMLDEREGTVPADEVGRSFNRQTLPVRAAIVAAGPVCNLLFAVIVYWLLFVTGIDGIRPVIGPVVQDSPAALAGLRDGDEIVAIDGNETPTWESAYFSLTRAMVGSGTAELTVVDPDGGSSRVILEVEQGYRLVEGDGVLANLGIEPWRPAIPAVIDQVEAGQPADLAGILPGDRIVAADGTDIDSWIDWVAIVRDHPGERIDVTVERDGQMRTIALTPRAIDDSDSGKAYGRIGAKVRLPENPYASMRTVEQFGPLRAVGAALEKSWDTSVLMLRMLGRMVVGEASVKNISGPLSIAEMAGRSASFGVEPFLSFLALISISLGVLNLLPIPLLDGGHLLYYLVELIKGSPVSEAVQLAGQRIGIALLLLLMMLAFYNDLTRLFG